MSTLEPATAAAKTCLHGGRAAGALLALAIVPAAVWIDALAALARGWRVDSRLDIAGLAAAAIWLLVALGLYGRPRGRAWLAGCAPQILALVVSLSGVWLLAELTLGSVLARQRDPLHRRAPGLRIVNRPQPGTMPGVAGTSIVTTNVWGVRGPDPPPRDQARRILCLGGSTTACTYLDDRETWPQQLADRLRAAGHKVWVGNAGLPSLTTAEHLRFVEQSELLDQLDELVIQCGVNDLIFALRGPLPPPPLWTDSRVYQLVHSVRRRWAQQDASVEDAAGAGYVWRRQRRTAAPIRTDLPPLDDALAAFENRLEAIVAACRRRKVPLVFTTQPVSWDPGLDAQFRKLLWFGALPDGRFLSVESLRAGMDAFNARLRDVCRRSQVPWIELSELNGRQDVFYDDCHFTELGAREVADRVARWFLARPTLSPRAGS